MGNLLVGLFGWVFSHVAKWASHKIVVMGALTATLLAVTMAFYYALKALIDFSVAQVTNEWFLMFFYAFWPSNADVCITACVSADLIAFAYRYKLQWLRYMSEA